MPIEHLPSVMGFAAVVPALLLLWLVVGLDKRPEPPLIVIATFLAGAAGIFLLRYAQIPFELLRPAVHDPWLALLIRALFSVAAPEDTVKILAFVAIAGWNRFFNEPMDGIVYGAAAGLGFAAYENLGYMFRHIDQWQTLAVMRNLLTVPFHAALGAIAGAYVARARFFGALSGDAIRTRTRLWWLACAWLVPVLWHTAFDFPLLALRLEMTKHPAFVAMLQASGLLVGGAALVLAYRMALRFAAHQHPLRDATAPAGMRRRIIWLFVLGGGLGGFVGIVMLMAAARVYLSGGDPSIAYFGIGAALVLASSLLFQRARRQLAPARKANSTPHA